MKSLVVIECIESHVVTSEEVRMVPDFAAKVKASIDVLESLTLKAHRDCIQLTGDVYHLVLT